MEIDFFILLQGNHPSFSSLVGIDVMREIDSGISTGQNKNAFNKNRLIILNVAPLD